VRRFVGFVLALNEAAKGCKLSERVPESQPVQALLQVGHEQDSSIQSTDRSNQLNKV
jgi:hypothetical protein